MGRFPNRAGLWEKILVPWADQVSAESVSSINQSRTPEDAKSVSKSISHEDLVHADASVQAAIVQLDKVDDPFAKLNMYFIASRLFQKVGDIDGVRKCILVLDKAFQACERNSSADEGQIKGATSVLNSMAYGLLPVDIPDRGQQQQIEVEPFSEKDFKASESLKLRAVAMADRLESSNDVRRRAHRDLVFWYMKLGKNEEAVKEKLVLFELVGIVDDTILYPQDAGCGRLVWWQTGKMSVAACGMG